MLVVLLVIKNWIKNDAFAKLSPYPCKSPFFKGGWGILILSREKLSIHQNRYLCYRRPEKIKRQALIQKNK